MIAKTTIFENGFVSSGFGRRAVQLGRSGSDDPVECPCGQSYRPGRSLGTVDPPPGVCCQRTSTGDVICSDGVGHAAS
jgi:hypothetical protein